MTLLETILLVSAVCLAVFIVSFAGVWLLSRGERQPVLRTSTVVAVIPVWLLYRWLSWGDAWDELATDTAVWLAGAAGVFLGGRLAVGGTRPAADGGAEQVDGRVPCDTQRQASPGRQP